MSKLRRIRLSSLPPLLWLIAWVGGSLVAASRPWSSFLGLLIALPYWTLSYIPAKLYRVIDILLVADRLPDATFPTPFAGGIPRAPTAAEISSNLLILLITIGLLVAAAGRTRSWRRRGRTTQLSVSALLAMFLTALHWSVGVLPGAFERRGASSAMDLILSIVAAPQQLGLRILGLELPVYHPIAGDFDWVGFVESSAAMTVMGFFLLVGSWELVRMALRSRTWHRPQNSSGTSESPQAGGLGVRGQDKR